MGFFRKLGNGFVDVVKAVHYEPLKNSVKNLTGRDMKHNVKYTTGAGRTTAKGVGVVQGVGYNIFGGMANGISGGSATKLSNSWRKFEGRQGDGTSFFGKNRGGFEAKYAQDMLDAQKTEKEALQAGAMAQQLAEQGKSVSVSNLSLGSNVRSSPHWYDSILSYIVA